MTPKKAFISFFLMLIKRFIEFLNLTSNSIYEFPDKGLYIEILTYSGSFDSITQPVHSLIQLSILLKIS